MSCHHKIFLGSPGSFDSVAKHFFIYVHNKTVVNNPTVEDECWSNGVAKEVNQLKEAV